MKTNNSSDLKQYARVARIIPKTKGTTTNARIKVVATTKGEI